MTTISGDKRASRKVLITNEVVRKAKSEEKPYEIRDTKLTGLLLRVQPSGVATFYYEYQRGKRIKVGRPPAITPDKARLIAGDIEAERRVTKKDPIEEKRRVQTENYIHFLDEVYKPWLDQRPHSHPQVAYDTLTKGFPELHKLKLNEITPGLIEKWRVRRRKEGVTENTINRQLSDLRACLNRAKDIWNLLDQNPLDKVKAGKIDKKAKIRYLTKDEEARLRKALDEREERIRAGRDSGNEWREERHMKPLSDLNLQTFVDHVKPAILLSLNTGLRRGELLNLKWEDVHLDRRDVTVVAATAKDFETRHIPLNTEALSILREWKAQPGVKSAYVFSDRGGQPIHRLRTSWETVLDEAKISDFRWHDLRHTFASNLVMAGVDLNTVRELLGHSDYKMTLRYAHLAPEHKHAAVDRLVPPAPVAQAR